jgi:hypothetical protein
MIKEYFIQGDELVVISFTLAIPYYFFVLYRYYDYLLFTKDQDTPLSSVSNLSPEMFNDDNENNEFDSNYVNSSIGIDENSIELTNEQVCFTLNNNYYYC